MSQIVLYLSHSTSVLSFYRDVVLTLSIKITSARWHTNSFNVCWKKLFVKSLKKQRIWRRAFSWLKVSVYWHSFKLLWSLFLEVLLIKIHHLPMFIQIYDALWCHSAILTARQGVKVKYLVITHQQLNYAISSPVSIDRPLFEMSRNVDMCHEKYTP